MTHVLSISSAQLPKPNLPLFNHCFIDIPNNAREALLLELPTACKFIGDAIASGGQVLVQCRVELRACIIVCAYCKSISHSFFCVPLHNHQPVMFTRHVSPRQAFALVENGEPNNVEYHSPTRAHDTLCQPFRCTTQRTTSSVI